MKRFITFFICFPLIFLFTFSSCESVPAYLNDVESHISSVYIFMRMVDGLTVTNQEGQSLTWQNYQLEGNMTYLDYQFGTGAPGSVDVHVSPSKSFRFQFPLGYDSYSVGIVGFDSDSVLIVRQEFFSFPGTATLYLDGSVVLDGDLTEFEVRIQLPEDREHQWIIKGNGAEQDHVEISFKDGEPVVESINDELTYTVEKEEIP